MGGVTSFVRALRYVGVAAVGCVGGRDGDGMGCAEGNPTEKAEHLRQQANPQPSTIGRLIKMKSGPLFKGFVAVTSGDQRPGSWKVEAQQPCRLAPNVLLGTSGCGGCQEILVAQGFQYEYPDLVVRIQQGGRQPGRWVSFGMKDAQNNTTRLSWDVSQKIIQVVRDRGERVVLGRAAIKPKPVEWHTFACSGIPLSARISSKHF